jgi:hypothetical protein
MRLIRPVFLTFFALLSISLLSSSLVTVRADDGDKPDEYDESARVVRISLLSGDVTIKRNGSQSWEQAELNMALVEGDIIATGADGRVEIQFDARNFVRLDHDSVVKVTTLRDEGIALSLSEGTASLDLARFDHDHEYFEIDAPKSTIAAEKTGRYRIDVARNGSVRVTARGNGRARIYSETSGFILRDDHTAELVFDGQNAGDWEIAGALTEDSWDGWITDRTKYLADKLRYDNRDRYYDSNVWGAEELDSYGDWSYSSEYGYVWCPRASTLSAYSDWSPYRYGSWVWCPPYGWTWVANEPWGWAPYHYGRWVYYNNTWGWAPRGYGYNYRRSWWRPALVAFVYVPSLDGERICWYPLTYGQRDPRSRYYPQSGRLSALRRDEFDRLQRTNPAYLRVVSGLPTSRFGRRGERVARVEEDQARRAFAGQPVRGRLPVLPSRQDSNGAAGRERTGTGPLTSREPGSGNPRVLANRPTGAASRTAGMPLDDTLRRERIFQGRATRGESSNSVGDRPSEVNGGNTGIVARPPRPGRPGNPASTTGNGGPVRDGVTGRPERQPRTEGTPTDSNTGSSGNGELRNAPPDRRATSSPGVTPGNRDATPTRPYVDRTSPRSEPRERRSETPTPRSDPQPETRRERTEPARETPRPERPSEPVRGRTESPRETPRPERSAEPRQERPAPAPRSESPRSEAPRSEAPRAEPPRESPRVERSSEPRQERSSPPAKSESRSEPSRPEPNKRPN